MIRWPARAFTVIALLLVGAFSACSSEDAAPPSLPITESTLARGKVIAEGFGSCGFCHAGQGAPGQSLAGGRVFVDFYGEVQPSNITRSSTGIGGWSEQDLRKIFRANTRPDGSLLYSPLHRGFEWMSESDVTAVAVYVRSLAGVDNTVERREPSFINRNVFGFFMTKSEVQGYVPQISPSFKTEYGQYVVDNIARCAVCHSKPGGLLDVGDYLGGGQEISINGVTKIAPNITSSKSSGIGSWSVEQLRHFLMTGSTADGKKIDSSFCPVEFYRNAPSDEIEAVVSYLRSVAAIE